MSLPKTLIVGSKPKNESMAIYVDQDGFTLSVFEFRTFSMLIDFFVTHPDLIDTDVAYLETVDRDFAAWSINKAKALAQEKNEKVGALVLDAIGS